MREEGPGTRASMERLFAEHRLRYRTLMEVSSNETIKQAVMAGMGLAFISAHTIGLEIGAGRLAILTVQGLPIVRDGYVIQLREKLLPPIAAAFRTFMLERGAQIIARTIGAPLATEGVTLRQPAPLVRPMKRGRTPNLRRGARGTPCACATCKEGVHDSARSS